MKWFIFFSLSVTVDFASAKPVSAGCELVDCGANKAVLIEGGRSSDGHYAVGWTIRPVGKKTEPVNWSALSASGKNPIDFIDLYPTRNEDAPNAPYEIDDCVVDLQNKTLLLLQSDWAYFPGKNRGHLAVVWSSPKEGSRFALIQNDARFFTYNLWLICLGDAKMSQVDLVPKLQSKVTQWLSKKRPDRCKEYGIFYELAASEEDARQGATFKKRTALIPISAEIPKSDEAVEGTVVIDLTSGSFRSILSVK